MIHNQSALVGAALLVAIVVCAVVAMSGGYSLPQLAAILPR